MGAAADADKHKLVLLNKKTSAPNMQNLQLEARNMTGGIMTAILTHKTAFKYYRYLRNNYQSRLQDNIIYVNNLEIPTIYKSKDKQ